MYGVKLISGNDETVPSFGYAQNKKGGAKPRTR